VDFSELVLPGAAGGGEAAGGVSSAVCAILFIELVRAGA